MYSSAIWRGVTSLNAKNSSSLFKEYYQKVAPTVKAILPVDLSARLKSGEQIHVLDVREPYEWNESIIPNATYTGRGRLEMDVENIVQDQDDAIVIYCARGFRSVLAAKALMEMGYRNVSHLEGGIGAWKEQELPTLNNSPSYHVE